jgi:hypothetical protein
MARSWSEIVHDAIYHPSGRPDPAFEAHLYREESIRLGREQLKLMEMQTSALERSLEQMQTQFSENSLLLRLWV